MTTQAQSLSELRKFYNHTITPELRRMENRRHKMLLFLAVSFLVLLGIILLQIYINILVVTLVLTIPLLLYISYIVNELDTFKSTFKPKVVNLLLDFIDNDVTYNVPLKYLEKGSISPSVFAASRLFNSAAPDFSGVGLYHG